MREHPRLEHASSRPRARFAATRILAIVLALAATEMLLRLAFDLPPVAHRLATNEDLSYQRAWIGRPRDAPDRVGKLDVFDPLLGWRPQPDLRISPIWNGKTLTTNPQGFRSTRPWRVAREGSKLRIIALGDSFTFGEEVSDGEVWTHQLESICPRLEVLNFGVHGYGHDQMLLLLREVGLAYRPDVVLLGFLKTDMYRNLLSFRDYAKPRFRLAGGDLVLTGVPVPTPGEIARQDRWRPRLIDFAAILSSRFQNLTGIRSLRKSRITAALLGEIARVTERAGARPVFAYLPSGPDFESVAENREREEFFWRFCEENRGVLCLSVSEPLLEAAARGGCCHVPSGYHWNARAHRLAARAILESLEQGGLVPGGCGLEAGRQGPGRLPPAP